MGCKIRELDIKKLQKEILCKCGRVESLASCYKEADDACQEDPRDVDTSSMKDEITEELPFDEILAEKRRKYTAKEEWEGYALRKKPSTMRENDTESDDIDESAETNNRYVSDVLLIKEGKNGKEEAHVLSWKLSLPDEFANINFYNGNSYSGRISRKMMEGEGTYMWHNGVRYEGQFEQNQIQGKGFLKWNDDCWYEGDFLDGIRHGEGAMVDRKHNCMHIGQWRIGKYKKV
ncbi:Radial spoke head 10-like protein B [Harpegnathos saltator]|uniref:Radial spoke head 10-like protein B n=1 Tax=Harpegnathos saltator TaxID=610380 RepID=E2BKN8_HARSA|nr:Radial spoke head 10-like protein B [Harpegnathos saltator]